MGVLPINLGPAKLQRTEHTFVHYYDLSLLYKEYFSLNNQYNTAKSSFKNASLYSQVENYDKMIQFIKLNIDNKIENIDIHSTSTKTKRGLFNGIGSLLKGLTGNLDANDGQRIDTILNHLKNNQMKLQEQIKMQYSVNNEVIKRFNDTLQDIQHNELALKSKIVWNEMLIQKGAAHQNILFARDIFNQLIILYNTVLNVLEEIENSLTFCKLKTLHPSIIKPKDLFLELQRISSHYKNQFPYELNFQNILDFESIIEIHCKVEYHRINYLLSIPIDYETLFDLYYLLPIPTKHESEFYSIIPDTKYVLKSKDNLVKPLNDKCTQGKVFHCPSYLQISSKTDCEKQILLEERTSHCQYNRLDIIENHMEIIPEIDQYLAVFPIEDELKFKCQEEFETRRLFGIYLVNGATCEVNYHNQQLNFMEKTYGKPLVMDKLPLDFHQANVSHLKIKLKSLKLGEISRNPILPITEVSYDDYYKPSVWTFILYIAVILVAVYIYRRWKLRTSSKPKSPLNQSNKIPEAIELQARKVNLPAEAQF